MELSRRRFLRQLTVLSGTSLLIALPACADSPPVWVVVGPAASFPKGTVKKVTLPPAQNKAVLYIRHADDDSFLALSARCTHKGCLVDWDSGEHEFVCPCHNGQFDAQVQRIGGPPRKPLPSYPTKVGDDGQLFVQA